MQGKKWRTPEHERQVIELYMQFHSVPKVAEMVDCGTTTIQNILNDNGIKQDGRRGRRKNPNKVRAEPKVKKSHCRSKYCPALIAMLHKAFGWNAKQIAEVTGYLQNGTRSVLKKRGLIANNPRVDKSDYDLDQIEYEYTTLGIPGRQLDQKYGLGEGTVCKWMCQRGVHLGKGAHQEGRKGKSKANGEFVYTERMQELNQLKHEEGERRFIQRLAEAQGDKFEYVGGFRDGGQLVATIRCAECGYEFVHGITDMGKNWQCPSCTEMTLARKNVIESIRRISNARERTSRSVDVTIRRMDEAKESLRAYLTDRECAVCGGVFHDVNPRRVCCCDECSKKYARKQGRGDFHRHRARKYNVAYDGTISLQGVFARDGGVCQICGEPCDWNDREYGGCGPTYPSIDHIVPFAQGGEHTWNNVQLAHFMCNSKKGAKAEVMLDAS